MINRSIILKKKSGIEKEREAVEILSKKYELVYRVPMSLLPFDILCISKSKGEIVFVEVKSKNSTLSDRQNNFMNIINSRSNWNVRYEVLKL